MTSLVSLLHQVKLVRHKYEEIARLNGENFNIFRILNLHASEVRTHTAFIGELLNPNGSHGQGVVFLRLFLEMLGIREFSFDNVTVRMESVVGSISDDFLEGGTIDLRIFNTARQGIILENKIYARDRKNQLLRYHNYGRTNYSSFFRLYYLTLNGTEPTPYSTGGQIRHPEDFALLSYSANILSWLELCRKEAVTHPNIRETITQYLNLIRYLTNQTTNNNMATEIQNILLLNKENYLNAYLIRDLLPNITKKIHQDVDDEIDGQIDGFFGNRDIIYMDKYKIRFGIYEYDGYFLKIWATALNGSDVDNANEEFDPVVKLLKMINPKFRCDGKTLGWHYIEFRTFWQDKELQFNLNDPAFRKQYVAEALTEPLADLQKLRTYLVEVDNLFEHYALKLPMV